MLYDQLQNVAFPMSDSKNVFAYSFEGVYQEDGWKVYDAEKELQRMVRRHNSWGGRGVDGGGGGERPEVKYCKMCTVVDLCI